MGRFSLIATLLLLFVSSVTSTSDEKLIANKPYAKDYPRQSVKSNAVGGDSSQGLKLAPNGNLKDICSDSTGQYLYAAEWPGYIYRSTNYGRTWNVSESVNAQWSGVVSDSTGQFLAAAVHGGGIYTSQNYGQTWNITSAPADIRWSGIASDGSGKNLAACWGYGNITISNNGGQSWHNSGAPEDSWMEIVSDVTGDYLYATDFAGYCYRSSDNGKTWESTQLLTDFSASSILSTSSSGEVVAVAFYSGPVYVSTNFGVNFHQVTGNSFWSSISVSGSSGNQLAVTNAMGTISVSLNDGKNWTVVPAPDYPWQTITSSTDGQYLAAAFEGYDSIFISPDYGLTWTQYEEDSTQFNWFAVVSDTTGQFLTAIVYGGYIYASVDYGANWGRLTAPYGFWYGLACTEDASTLAAVRNYGGAYLSTNSGATWSVIASLPLNAWSGIAMNGNGTYMAASILGGGIWVSSDAGSTWAASSAPTFAWTGISASADSSYFVAVQGGGYLSYNNYSYVYLSPDFGKTWIRTNEYSSGWVSVSADSTGKDVLAATSGGPLYYSSTYGATWQQLSPPGFYTWKSVALNATGQFILAGSIDGGVWISFNSGLLWNLTTLPNNLLWQGVATDDTGTRITALASGNAGQGGIYSSSNYGVIWTAAVVTEVPLTCQAGYIVAGVICIPCSPGTTSAAGTNTVCTACPSGTYAPIAGSAFCLSCPLNYYASGTGASSCSSCPSGYITDDTGSTKQSECRNSGGVIVLGLICLVLSVLLVNIYLCYGRLNRISLYRKRHLVQPSLQRSSQAQLASDLLITLDSFIATTLQSVSTQSFILSKGFVFICGSALTMFVSIMGALVYGLVHILFTSLILYRGYMQYADLPRDFREVVRRLFDAFGVRGVAYPVATVGGALAESDLDLTEVEASCEGGLSAQYLLMYLILIGLILIMIRSELQVYWKIGVEPILTRTWSYLMTLSKRQDIQHTHHRYTHWGSVFGMSLTTFLLYLIPAPRKWIQFLLGYIYIFRFFDHDGRHNSNDNCSDADTLMSVITSAYVYLIALPVVVLIAVYIMPGFGQKLTIVQSNMLPASNPSTTTIGQPSTIAPPPSMVSEFDADYVKFSERPSTLHKGLTNTSAVNARQVGLVEVEDPNSWLGTINRYLSPCYSLLSIVGGIDWIIAKIAAQFAEYGVFSSYIRALKGIFASATASPLSSTSMTTSVASLGTGPARTMQNIQDQSETMTKMFIPEVTWFGMLFPYEKNATLLSESEIIYDKRFSWANDHNQGMNFPLMVMEVRAWLASSMEISPTTWLYSLIVKPLSYTIFCQLCTEYGRTFWGEVLYTYVLYAGVSFGVWTDSTLDHYGILRDYYRFQRVFYAVAQTNINGQLRPSEETTSDASFYDTRSTNAVSVNTVTTTGIETQDLVQMIVNEHTKYHRIQHPVGDALQRAVYDDLPSAFQRYLFSILSVRLSLLQLIPVFTVWSVFAVELHARMPLFVFTSRLNALLPSWWEFDAISIARKYLVEEYHFWHNTNRRNNNANSRDETRNTPVSSVDEVISTVDLGDEVQVASIRTWEVYMLGIYLWSRRSRIVEYFLIFMLTVTSCALVFSPDKQNGDDTVGETDDGAGTNDAVTGLLGFCNFLLVMAGLFQSLYYVLRLHRWLFPRYRSLTPDLTTAAAGGGSIYSKTGSVSVPANAAYLSTSSAVSTVNPLFNNSPMTGIRATYTGEQSSYAPPANV